MTRTRMADEIDAMIQDWVGRRDAAEVDRILNEAGLVCGPVYSIADIFNDAQYRARDMLVEADDPQLGRFVMPGITPKLSATPADIPPPGSWELGADNDAVYGDLLGIDAGRLSVLRTEGVI
jgi:crotonobetainyl-CoA:carnitine CoA-transferase CaiB-like acyl-CoA transferase